MIRIHHFTDNGDKLSDDTRHTYQQSDRRRAEVNLEREEDRSGGFLYS